MSSVRLFFIQLLFSILPPTRAWGIKRLLLRCAGGKIGKDVRVVSSARVYLTGDLAIGDNTWIGHEVLVVGGDAPIHIGSRVDIAPRVMLVTGAHYIDLSSDRAAGMGYSSPIIVEDGVWIGASSTILGGVTVGRCSIVAAGALVNSDVPEFSLVAGVPARVIRRLDGL